MSSAPIPSSPIPSPDIPRRSMTRQRWVETVLPLATSIAVHAGLVLLGFLFLRAGAAVFRPVTQEQLIVPDSTLAEAGPAGGIPNPGLGEDPNRASAQDRIEIAADSGGWAQRPSQTLTRALVGEVDAGESVISLGAGSAIGRSMSGSPGGDAGQLAPFGIPGGGAGRRSEGQLHRGRGQRAADRVPGGRLWKHDRRRGSPQGGAGRVDRQAGSHPGVQHRRLP